MVFLRRHENRRYKSQPQKSQIGINAYQLLQIIQTVLVILPLMNALRVIAFLVLATQLVARAGEILALKCSDLCYVVKPFGKDGNYYHSGML